MAEEGAPPKRRRNRKKKSKGGGSGEKNNDNNNNASKKKEPKQEEQPKPDQMNPHAVLRSNLFSEGFSYEEIDKAMEEMWDKDLAYDEFDAVLKYLKSGGESAKAEESNDEKEEGEKKDDVEEKKAEKEVGEATKANEEPKAVAAPATMAEKLDMVAGFENLTDAIFALSEWVTKAAKPQELEDLCAAEKTGALPVIIKRSIMECEIQSMFDGSVFPAMLRLMESLLKRCSIPSSAIVSTQTSFGTLLKQARRVVLMNHKGSDEFADRVSRFLVSRVALAVDESKLGSGGSDGSSKKAKAASSTSSSIISSSMDQGIAELLSKREMNKTAARHSSVIARSAFASLTSGGAVTPALNGSTGEMELGKADILLAIAGEDAKGTFAADKVKLEDLKSQLKEGESESVQKLRSEVDEVTSEREMIEHRIAELKQSIEKLEIYDAELCAKVVDINSEIESESSMNSAETKRINEEMKQATEAVKYGNSVNNLVDMLKIYGDSLDKAVNGTLQAASKDTDATASKKVEAFVSRARSYFASEAQCVTFLQDRIQSSKKEAEELKIEVEECEGLGMVTTIGQMKQTITEKEELVVKDTALKEKLREEAFSMFDVLVDRLEQYSTAKESGAHSLSPIDVNSLQDITSCVAKLGIPNGERLSNFITQSESPRSTDPIVTQTNTQVAPIGTPKPQKAAVPKFTWAKVSTASAAPAKTSLLDIQKEELQSREVS